MHEGLRSSVAYQGTKLYDGTADELPLDERAGIGDTHTFRKPESGARIGDTHIFRSRNPESEPSVCRNQGHSHFPYGDGIAPESGIEDTHIFRATD